MQIRITLGKEPSLTRVYEYDENVDYNEKITDIIDSLKSLND